jgi:hypothetical protein
MDLTIVIAGVLALVLFWRSFSRGKEHRESIPTPEDLETTIERNVEVLVDSIRHSAKVAEEFGRSR